MKNIRYYIFWVLDFFRGSPVRKHFIQIQTVYNDNNGTKDLQEDLLKSILEYAVKHTKYYANYNSESIKNFPVIDKSHIIANMESMFSYKYKNKKDRLRIMHTSGSTGTPFKIYQDPGKVLRNKADLIFYYKIGSYNVGDRYYYMRIWTERNKKSKIALFKENFRMIDTANLDEQAANAFIKNLTSDKKGKVLLGITSSFSALMEYSEMKKYRDWNIKAIFTQSEELPVKVKKKMQKIFNCTIMARYSNQENGMIGQQPSTGEDYFELNLGSYFIEFLKLDSDEPADEMEEARIVITDLFNKAVPMIRYDTGDVGIFSNIVSKTGKKQKILHSIQGRKTDYLYTNQMKKISPAHISPIIGNYDCIKQFQLIQNDYDKVTLKLVYRESIKKDEIEEQLTKSMKQIFGEETNLKIKNLENIPIEVSGKRKYIISRIEEKV